MSGMIYMKPAPPPSPTGATYLPIKITINGRTHSTDDLISYTVDDVEYINHIRKADMRNLAERRQGFNAHNYPCCIEFYMKPGREYGIPDVQTCQVIGYSENLEFYHPVYDTPEKIDNSEPDKRTTVYWNPYVETDSGGSTTIEFYTNDSEQADYEITIEGLNPEGTAYRYRRQLCN